MVRPKELPVVEEIAPYDTKLHVIHARLENVALAVENKCHGGRIEIEGPDTAIVLLGEGVAVHCHVRSTRNRLDIRYVPPPRS